MSKTAIQWSEQTWNPVVGCSLKSPGCTNCYAMKMARRLELMGQAKYAGLTQVVNGNAVWTGEVRLDPKALTIPVERQKPTTYFVNSMSDLFHEALTDEQISLVFQAICRSRGRHWFQILTKRSDRLPEWFAWAQREWVGWFNSAGQLDLWETWIGVSVEDAARKFRIDHLREVPTRRRFLSLEPLLGDLGELDLSGIGWVIVGGESGGGARPCQVSWLLNVVRQCQEQGVPVFVKQLGSNPILTLAEAGGEPAWPPSDRKGGEPAEWPEALRVREMPVVRQVAA